MSNENAGQPVDRDRLGEAEAGQDIVDDAASAKDADQSESADENGEAHWDCHQTDQPDTTGKIRLPGEGAGDGQGDADGEKRRQESLPEGERQYRADDGVGEGLEQAAGQPSCEQGCECDTDEAQDDRQNEKAARERGQPPSFRLVKRA